MGEEPIGNYVQSQPSAPSTPSTIMVGTLPSPSIRLRRPLDLRVEKENEFITVWNEELEELGYGPNLAAAVEDFQQTLLELYRTLQAEQGNLGPEMQALWRRLSEYIEERL